MQQEQPLSFSIYALKILKRAAEPLLKYTAPYGTARSYTEISARDQRLVSVVNDTWTSMMFQVRKSLLI